MKQLQAPQGRTKSLTDIHQAQRESEEENRGKDHICLNIYAIQPKQRFEFFVYIEGTSTAEESRLYACS